jgi:predicted enzyme related to lactoylglutathione lyase
MTASGLGRASRVGAASQEGRACASSVLHMIGRRGWRMTARDIPWPDGTPCCAAVFGYQYGDRSGGGFSYATARVDGTDVDGIGDLHAGLPADTPAGWRVYFGAADTDASVARVQASGGSVIRAPADHPYGRMSTVADNQGAVFSLLAATPG